MSDTIVSLVKSRRASIVKLQDEVAELGKQMAPLPLSSAPRMALASVVKVKETRLAKLREELRGFEQLLGDSRQLEVPGASASSSEHPAPGAVAGRGSGRR